MGIFSVRVIPNAKQNRIVDEGDRLKVHLTSPPADGRANKALIDFLANHFTVKKNSVKIIKGEKSRDKIVEISD